ncbi:branched-chain amino acid ABC transporter permease [Microbacterium immunditiarum]|uniref:Branched-chain amino acid transport system permease protein n=1 Tax=Microbacterium immunditiarum TaxID=337480 RepID=A0A7Y9KK45_9MICO|nr:branched-chain amino acid ABC transporter permease [Microbacterium immunditiarum]NYE18459.1 branched-chain amino acid transport system permease protein [Microbacterium immunditiarum]
MLAEIISGLSIGSVYVLLALGFTLTLGVGDMVNLAHGATVVAGMYVVYTLVAALGLNAYVGVVLAGVVCALLSAVVYVVAIVPSRSAGGGHNLQVVYTLVLSSLLVIIFQLVWGGQLVGLPFRQTEPWRILGVPVDPARGIAFFVAVALSAVFMVWLRYSLSGRLMRMTGRYTEGAYAIGVPVQWVFVAVFCLGGAMAGVAGGLLMTIQPVSPTLGFGFLIVALIVSIAARLSMFGVVLVGFFYGIAQAVLNSLIDPSLTSVVIFVAFLAILSIERVVSTTSNRARRA